MKAFFAGIMGAVIAGLILFFAQNWWSSQQTNAKQRVQFDNKAEVVLKKDQVQNLLNKMDYQDLVIQVVSVSNVGQDDIADRSFSDATDYVWGYDNISSPNGNPKNAILTYDGKVLTVRYRLLPAGALLHNAL